MVVVVRPKWQKSEHKKFKIRQVVCWAGALYQYSIVRIQGDALCSRNRGKLAEESKVGIGIGHWPLAKRIKVVFPKIIRILLLFLVL